MLIQFTESTLIPDLEKAAKTDITPYQYLQLTLLAKYAKSIIENPADLQDQRALVSLMEKMQGKRDRATVLIGAVLMSFMIFSAIAALAFFALGIAASLTGGGILLTVAMIGFSVSIITPVKNLLHSLMHKNDSDYKKTRSLFSRGLQLIKDDKKSADHSVYPAGALLAQGFYKTLKEANKSKPVNSYDYAGIKNK